MSAGIVAARADEVALSALCLQLVDGVFPDCVERDVKQLRAASGNVVKFHASRREAFSAVKAGMVLFGIEP
jgi:hypothetical protein